MAEKEKTGVTIPGLGGISGTALEEGKSAMLTRSDNAEVFMLMNTRDEAQIMRELMGAFAKEYVYSIPFKNSDGSTTHADGLSWSGIKEARRLYGGIDVDIVEGPDLHGDPNDMDSFYTCKARAKDLKTGNATTAAYRQKLWGKRKGDGHYKIEFAYEFCQSKAKRNAIAELLPQPLVKAWISDFKDGKESFDPHRVKELEEGKDFSVKGDEKKGGGKKAPAKGGGRKSGGRQNGGGGGRGRRGDGGGPPMTAPQFGMIHKQVREKGAVYPSFMLDDSGNPYKNFEDMPEEKKVPVGTASDIISKLLAGEKYDDPGTPASPPPVEGGGEREPGQDDSPPPENGGGEQAAPEAGEEGFALE